MSEIQRGPLSNRSTTITPADSHESSQTASLIRPTLYTGDGSRRCAHALLKSLTVRRTPYAATGSRRTSAGPLSVTGDHLQALKASCQACTCRLGGPRCYIDLSIFDDPIPHWMQFTRHQTWAGRGLNVTFGDLRDVDWAMAGKSRYVGLRQTT